MTSSNTQGRERIAPVSAYAADIRRWCEKLNCAPDNNPEMVKDYIDTRWPSLSRGIRTKIFAAAMKPIRDGATP